MEVVLAVVKVAMVALVASTLSRQLVVAVVVKKELEVITEDLEAVQDIQVVEVVLESQVKDQTVLDQLLVTEVEMVVAQVDQVSMVE
jgi:hypothetical protein